MKNYLKITWRNLRKNTVFSLINLLGLSLGLTCSILIFLWVSHERHVDQFAEGNALRFVVYERQFTGGEIKGLYHTPGIMADEMKRVLPQVAYATGIAGVDRDVINTFRYGEKVLKANGGYAGKAFFQIMPYKILAGTVESALASPSDIAISQAMADRFFDDPAKAIGKTIRYNDTSNLRVAAVFKIPANASFKPDYLINWFTFLGENKNMQSWNNTGVYTYLLLKPQTSVTAFGARITHFLDQYAEFSGDYHVELGLQRVSDMYLHGVFDAQGYPNQGKMAYIHLFSIVAFFILLIACINFMNLSTAESLKRAREIGVRKVVGALRLSLIGQFMTEAILMAFISMGLALFAVALLLPAFNGLTGGQIAVPFSEGGFWMRILGITLATGVLSGSYPAFFLSSFDPLKALGGSLKTGKGGLMMRRILVVSQFSLSVVLIIGTWVVTRQVDYIQSRDLGYSREQLLYVPQEGTLASQYTLFKQRVLAMPGIQSVSRISYQEPSNMTSFTWDIDWEGKAPDFKPTFYDAGVGYDFCRVMGIKILQGHDFAPGVHTDSIGYILNQAAVRETGYTDPIGKPFTLWGRKATIVGVVKDFNYNSLHRSVAPLVLYMENNGYVGNLLIKTKPGQAREALASLQKVSKELNPAFPFTYQFADVAFDRLYRNEQMTGKISHYFALLAIFISCLGLLGLAMFSARQRVREIGIRKVLGASVVSLFGLICREFVALVLIALVLAIPVAWWLMHQWLQGYAYHVALDWWIFPLAGLLTLCIALATVSMQAIKAATINPVKNLRTE